MSIQEATPSVASVESGRMWPYPKIETLFNRDPENMKHVIHGDLRDESFGLVDKWLVTEKVDGTNVRVGLTVDGEVRFGGRSDNAQMPLPLLTHLTETFPRKLLASAFDEGVVATLYGEGYGARIQKAGGNYRSTPSFRLFDVRVGDWWLNWEGVEAVADKLGILTVPILDVDCTTEQAIEHATSYSEVARVENDCAVIHEGIVCRTDPLLLMRNGKRLVWKLKASDFPTPATANAEAVASEVQS